ncbi:AIR synthase [Frankia sp. AgB1.9]|uniref:MSMEG_0567/sll0787 family protein n=1 Tax=unclassified Frankia TaxID=2632575 RepID=UPI00193432B8|nr:MULTISPECIES: MSMEG_0567/sll0787 family protein [unclassified Frankia]MBL7494214.1 AIR synthase [Frankia sp. AgW1.1]MBL7546413.1 AIR synthase [Frankia sp. AgB1.9]MBL7623441.1 AIR synthase [Frankia sp. AgB1.8]
MVGALLAGDLIPAAPISPVGLAGRPGPVDTLAVWGDPGTLRRRPPYRIERAYDATTIAAYHRLRRAVFVDEQGLFADGPTGDLDETDEDPRTTVLVARALGGPQDGQVIGGVRLGPTTAWPGPDIGWWQGGRLAVRAAARQRYAGVGGALVRAACAHAEAAGALRFDATVQQSRERFFGRLGWMTVGPTTVNSAPHALMRWPIHRVAMLAAITKAPLGALLGGLRPGGTGFVGDDGAPVPGTDMVAACDAILPAMVDRDPFWAGWCGVLVNLNDLAAMGAQPLGLLDAVAGPTESRVSRVLAGLRAASDAFAVPILGGHSQLGVASSLAVTAVGRAEEPIRAGAGLPGHVITVTADLAGGWRPGYTGRQWDSTSTRRTAELRGMLSLTVRHRPVAAKDVSMAGIVGTLGMLAEASGCSAELDVARVPRPAGVPAGDWLTCFPGFAMVTADVLERPMPAMSQAVSACCGRLVPGSGVSLLWPDGLRTPVLGGHVTGMGPA